MIDRPDILSLLIAHGADINLVEEVSNVNVFGSRIEWGGIEWGGI